MTPNAIALDARHQQSQTLTPRLQYAVRLLQMSAQDYVRELHDMAAANPFIELDDATPATSPPTDARALASSVVEDVGAAGEPGDREPRDDAGFGGEGIGGEGIGDRELWMQSAMASSARVSHGPVDALDFVPAEIDLRRHLREQAGLLPLTPRDHALVCSVIESLDDDGYLRLDLSAIAAFAELDPATDECELSTALKLVQSFEPMGVGARTLAECLALQIVKLPDECRELASAIVDRHLDRLAAHDLAGIARIEGRALAEVAQCADRIRRLDPKPGSRYGQPRILYATPDVIVRKLRGRWHAELNAASMPRLRLNSICAELFRQNRSREHAALAGHLQEAHWALRNMEQRMSTILQVAQSILRRQRAFLDHGPFAMKPMSLREVAEDVGVHESTVCRVTNNKYMATPLGVFELKRFFSRALPMTDGAACSPTAIRELVKEMILQESPAHPLSDADITRRLARQGVVVARRTVTKYRQQTKLAAVDQRRAMAAAAAA